MNERTINVGMTKDGYYYAMWANDLVIYDEKTPEQAVKKLLLKRYPTIWLMNDKNVPNILQKTMINGKEKEFGSVPSEFVNKETGKLLCENRGSIIDRYEKKIKELKKGRLENEKRRRNTWKNIKRIT